MHGFHYRKNPRTPIKGWLISLATRFFHFSYILYIYIYIKFAIRLKFSERKKKKNHLIVKQKCLMLAKTWFIYNYMVDRDLAVYYLKAEITVLPGTLAQPEKLLTWPRPFLKITTHITCNQLAMYIFMSRLHGPIHTRGQATARRIAIPSPRTGGRRMFPSSISTTSDQ